MKKAKRETILARYAMSLCLKTQPKSCTALAPALMYITKSAWLNTCEHRLNRVDFPSCALMYNVKDPSQARETSKRYLRSLNWSVGLDMSGRWSGIDNLVTTSNALPTTVTITAFARKTRSCATTALAARCHTASDVRPSTMRARLVNNTKSEHKQKRREKSVKSPIRLLSSSGSMQ